VKGEEQSSLFIVLYLEGETSEIPVDEDIVYEGTRYDVYVGYNITKDDGSSPEIGIATNVTVIIPWANPYYINAETPFVTIELPTSWGEDSFLISATKEGYSSAEKTYLISAGKLSLSLDRSAVPENEEIRVTVRDQLQHLVQGATVFFEGYENDQKITDMNGIAVLTAPFVDRDSDISVIAYKHRYQGDSSSINVLRTSSIPSFQQIAPIILSALVVVCAIMYVGIRKRRAIKLASTMPPPHSVEGMQQVFTDDKEDVFLLTKRNHGMSQQANTRPPSVYERGPKVEEIRIHETQVKKEVETLSDEKKKEKPETSQEKHGDEWFKGTDYMRSKIDELTGEIDTKKDGKWFEGVDDIQKKVDEKLKQRSKKKTDEDEEK